MPNRCITAKLESTVTSQFWNRPGYVYVLWLPCLSCIPEPERFRTVSFKMSSEQSSQKPSEEQHLSKSYSCFFSSGHNLKINTHTHTHIFIYTHFRPICLIIQSKPTTGITRLCRWCQIQRCPDNKKYAYQYTIRSPEWMTRIEAQQSLMFPDRTAGVVIETDCADCQYILISFPIRNTSMLSQQDPQFHN